MLFEVPPPVQLPLVRKRRNKAAGLLGIVVSAFFGLIIYSAGGNWRFAGGAVLLLGLVAGFRAAREWSNVHIDRDEVQYTGNDGRWTEALDRYTGISVRVEERRGERSTHYLHKVVLVHAGTAKKTVEIVSLRSRDSSHPYAHKLAKEYADLLGLPTKRI